MPDTVIRHDAFGVDHYRPKRRFPELEFSYDNLFYCCNACNARKGDYWPAPADEGTRFVPNPCAHRMFDHLRYHGARVVARTDAGTAACDLLQLNSEEFVSHRETVIASAEAFARDLAKTQRALAGVDAALAGAVDEDRRAQLTAARRQFADAASTTGEHLRRLGVPA